VWRDNVAYLRRVVIAPDRLSELPFFRGMPAHALERLAEAAAERAVPAGRILITQHDVAATVWLLRSGAVQVLIRLGAEDALVGVLHEPGALLGWSAFRPPYRYTASIRCETACEFVVLPAAVFDELVAEDPALATDVLRRVAAAVTRRFENARAFLVTMPRQGPVGTDAR
jgi:CRP-like cAMP-binding protein